MRSSGSRKLLYHANIINLEERLRAVGRFENPWGASINLEGIICSRVEIGLTNLPKFGAGALCEMGFYADISWESRCNIEINV